MIKNSRGNAGKPTRRCPHCGFENVVSTWGFVPKHERRIAHTCGHCGEWIILDPAAWRNLHTKGDAAYGAD